MSATVRRFLLRCNLPCMAERDLSRADCILGLYSQGVRQISATNSPAFRVDLHLYEAFTRT
jgi:hypothetical protein